MDDINLSIKAGEQVALVGFSGSGKSTLAMVISQLYDYSSGSVKIDGRELKDMTKRDVVENLGVVAQHPAIFSGTVGENLLYSCQSLATQDEEATEKVKMPDLDRTIESVQQVGLFQDVLGFGLKKVIKKGEHEKLVETLVRKRSEFQDRFGGELADDVEFLDAGQFHYYSSVAENLTFGDPVGEDFAYNMLYLHPGFSEHLKAAKLYQPLLNLGRTASPRRRWTFWAICPKTRRCSPKAP